MAISESQPSIPPNPPSPDPSAPSKNAQEIAEDEDEDEEEEDVEVEMEDDDDEEEEEAEASEGAEASKLKNLARRMSTERIFLRVHDIIIKGNAKTKDSLIEAQLEHLKNVTTFQDLLQAAAVANARLEKLDIFDSVSITIDQGPSELPGTANVIVKVVEAKNPVTGDVGIFSKPETDELDWHMDVHICSVSFKDKNTTEMHQDIGGEFPSDKQVRSWSLEGSLKWKNMFGFGDIWDVSGAYGWDQASEISSGVLLPQFMALSTPILARISLLSQDWLKFSSYKERLLGISLGLLSTKHHDLAYNLTWRTLTDPSRMSSQSIRRQLGHSLLSSMKYTYKIDQRDSQLRPTRGYAFGSLTHIGGLMPDSRSLRFIRQEFDLRYALPLGFWNAALNFGISAGLVLPWGKGFMSMPSPLPERFFIGGHASPVCSLGGPSMLLGFKPRGLGPTEARRLMISQSDKDETAGSPGRDVLGGDLAVTAFADLSFNLPLKLFRESGIHGHIFVSAGNLAKLTENEYQNFSLRKFADSFRSSAGLGIIVPTKVFRMEINYCYILKQFEHDRGKTGIQFNFSSPSVTISG